MILIRNKIVVSYIAVTNIVIFGLNYYIFQYALSRFGEEIKFLIAIALIIMFIGAIKTVERKIRAKYQFDEPEVTDSTILPYNSIGILSTWLVATFMMPAILFGIVILFLNKTGIDISTGSSAVIVNVPLGLYVAGVSLKNIQYYNLCADNSHNSPNR